MKGHLMNGPMILAEARRLLESAAAGYVSFGDRDVTTACAVLPEQEALRFIREPTRSDAMFRRVAGSYGSGKRR